MEVLAVQQGCEGLRPPVLGTGAPDLTTGGDTLSAEPAFRYILLLLQSSKRLLTRGPELQCDASTNT